MPPPTPPTYINPNPIPILLLVVELPRKLLQPINRQCPESHKAREAEHIHPVVAAVDGALAGVDAVLVDAGLVALFVKQLTDVVLLVVFLQLGGVDATGEDAEDPGEGD